MALGAAVEPEGPLPPIKIHFRKPPPPEKSADDKKKQPKRIVSPPAKNPPPLPQKLDDPEWSALSFADPRERLNCQIAQSQARVRVPDGKTVHANLPADIPDRDKPIRIQWSLLTYGYQPRLTAAWFGGLRAFREESEPISLGSRPTWVGNVRWIRCGTSAGAIP